MLASLNSNQYYAMTNAGDTSKFEFHGRMGYVHIDDVAMCHILAYEHPHAHGRYLCNSKNPERPYYEFNTGKIQSLGFRFKSIEEMFDDCVSSFVEQGHLSPNPCQLQS
ncbi:hypothetical protein V2J09_021841 [Rumex salicifolius]